MRVARRVAVTVVVTSALLSAAASAGAATPTPTPTASVSKIVQYAGTSHYTDLTDGTTGTAQTTATIDCSQLPCVLTALSGINQDGFRYDSFGGGGPVPVVDGRADVQRTAAGDVCSSYYIGAGRLAISPGATPGSLHLIRTTATSDNNVCPNSVTEWDGLSIEGDVTAQSGQFCLVDGDCPTPAPTPTPTATPTVLPAGATPLRSIPQAEHVADPSTLSALAPVASALTPANVIWAVAATVVLVLLIAFPSHLLNAATEAGTDKVSEWWRRTRARWRRPAATAGSSTAGSSTAVSSTAVSLADGAPPHPDAVPPKPVNLAGWPLAAVGVLAASFISSFVDPGFGFNAASVRVFLSILVSFLLDAVAGWFLLILLVRRTNPHATARFQFVPATLLVVVVAVVFTRLTGFSPGIVFGLVAGVAFGAITATAEKARQVLVGLGYSFVLAIVGWVGYSVIAGAAGAHPAAPVVFVQETLSSMAIGGIAALPIVLVPVRGMSGYELFRWNRWVWGAAYAVGLLGFFLVLMPKPFSWATVGLSIWTWIAIYIAYAAVALGLWLGITQPWKREHADVDSPDAAPGT